MADKWVRMTEEEYREYKRGRVANEAAWKEGYDKGYADAQHFFESYTRDYDEMENDDNFNDC